MARLIGVVVLALVLATTAVVADAEVAVANADTEAQAQAQAQTQTQAVAEAAAAAVAETQAATATETTAAAATETQAAAATEATAEASTEAAAGAEAAAEATTETAAAAEATAEATAEASGEAEAPADAKKKGDKKPAPKTFKPTIINRDTRLAMRSQRRDIRYPDGSLAPILSFGPRPARPAGAAVDADVVSFPANSPLARRFARWADAVAERKQKYVTPTYADEKSRQRYVSYVPNSAFFAPRRPTHFEPEYSDEHHLLNGDFAAYFASLGAPVMPVGAAPFVAVPRGPRTFEAEYEDEHALLNGELPSGANVEYVFDLPEGVDLEDLLSYERAVYPDSPRARPSAYDMYGLPQFPALPASAAHLATAAAPFSGLDDPLQPIPSGVHTKVAYPQGSGAKADLEKLDFALNRLASLNAQLRAAEQKVAESRAEQQVLQGKLQRLNRIRANLQRLAGQIAALESRVGQNPAVQAEVARVASSKVQGVPVLGEWLKFN